MIAAAFIVLAIVAFRRSGAGWREPHHNALDLGKFAVSLMWISLSYCGFNAAVYMSSEVSDAKRNVPRAMLIATVAVTVLYVVLNAIFVYAPTYDQVALHEDVAVVSANVIGGEGFAKLVRA